MPVHDLAHNGRPLRSFLTYRLSRLQAALNGQAARILKAEAGLSLTQWRILALIASHEGASASELTQASGMDKGLFSRKLKTLISDGLARARPLKHDHRAQALHLTEAGQRMFEAVMPKMRARQDALRASLEHRELEALLSAIDKLETAASRTEFA